MFSFSYPNPLQCGASKFQHSIFDAPHVIIQCILGESVFSSDHEKYWKQKRTITRFRLYKKSFSKLNTNTTYLEKMQCFSFAERIATSFCNHQSTKTKKPQKGVGNQSQNSVSLSRKLIRILMLERAPEKGYKHLIMKKK